MPQGRQKNYRFAINISCADISWKRILRELAPYGLMNHLRGFAGYEKPGKTTTYRNTQFFHENRCWLPETYDVATTRRLNHYERKYISPLLISMIPEIARNNFHETRQLLSFDCSYRRRTPVPLSWGRLRLWVSCLSLTTQTGVAGHKSAVKWERFSWNACVQKQPRRGVSVRQPRSCAKVSTHLKKSRIREQIPE